MGSWPAIYFVARCPYRDRGLQGRPVIGPPAGFFRSFLQRCQLFLPPDLGDRFLHKKWNQKHPRGSDILGVPRNRVRPVVPAPGHLPLYELGLHIEVPEDSIADPVLFLHIVLFTAALATLPHRNLGERKPYRAILDFLILLCFWGFLYGYTIFPSEYLASSGNYGM